MGNDNSPIDTIKNIVGVLTIVGTGAFAFLKWLDSRHKDARSEKEKEEQRQKENKSAREDWLIENAFDIVKGLRDELDRLRAVNLRQSDDLDSAYARIRHLENALRSHGIEVPNNV